MEVIKLTLSKDWDALKNYCESQDKGHAILIDLNHFSHNLKYVKNYGYYLDDNWEAYNFSDYNMQQSLKLYFIGYIKIG